MDNFSETIATINETTLKAIGTFQEQVLAFNREIASALGKVELPSWLPTPEPGDLKVDRLVKQAFDFQTQRIEADKQFALGLLDIWTPAAPKSSSSATK